MNWRSNNWNSHYCGWRDGKISCLKRIKNVNQNSWIFCACISKRPERSQNHFPLLLFELTIGCYRPFLKLH